MKRGILTSSCIIALAGTLSCASLPGVRGSESGAPPRAHGRDAVKTRLTQAVTKAVAQAVQDEVYDYEYEVYYFPEGGPVGDLVSESRTRVPLYISPWIEGGVGQAIYKLMPHGEVLRLFSVRADGTIVLGGDPELGFPASQPNRKTVYFNDRDVERMKHNWTMSSFLVDLDPSSDVIQAAVSRQKVRHDGFSAWEFVHSNGTRKKF